MELLYTRILVVKDLTHLFVIVLPGLDRPQLPTDHG